MKITHIIYAVCLMSSFVACKRNELEVTVPMVSVNVVNAVTGGPVVKMNTNVTDSVLGYNSFLFKFTEGNQELKLFASSDAAHPYLDAEMDLIGGGIYSLYMTGTYPTIDTMRVKEHIPAYSSDSTVAVRVVNLSPNSGSLHVALASDATKNVFSGLTYQTITDFVKVPLKLPLTTDAVTFQIRNESNQVLATYQLPDNADYLYPTISVKLSRNRAFTLVIKGTIGATNDLDAIGLFPVPNY